jgi:nucleoside-diphosphate-sugar epimerase
MAGARVLILGCGYTGKRVARSLAAAGVEVVVTTRNASGFGQWPGETIELDAAIPSTFKRLAACNTPGFVVLHSIPTLKDGDPTPALMAELAEVSRVLYLSTTGVYGSQRDVDEKTVPNPASSRELLRIHAEQSVAQSKSHLILRPAAIYGPFRGIHASMQQGKYRLAGDGGNFVSRIHVDDLVSHCIAGLFSPLTGAWPVADEDPCEAREIAAFCAELLDLPIPESVEASSLGETRRADRRVDGSAVRKALGIQLRYPSYRVGIPACVAAEAVPRDF